MWYENESFISFLSGIVLMAVLHGILLALILYFNKDLNTKSNKFLSLSILGICIIILYEFLYWNEWDEIIPVWIHLIPFYIRTTIPVGIYFFVTYLINPEHRITKLEKLAFWAIGVEVFLHVLYTPIYLFVENSETSDLLEYVIIVIGWLISTITMCVLIPRAYQKVRKYQSYLFDNYSTTERKELKWLQNFLILNLFFTAIWIITLIQFLLGYWDASDLTFGILTIGFVILLFWIGYFLILKHKWISVASVLEEGQSKNKSILKLSSKIETYYDRLIELMREEKVYTNVDLTLQNLSEKLQISGGYLSKIIKEKENRNFFEFINHYRIEAVKSMLKNDEFNNYTIMAIAEDCGFNSKSTFNKVFKSFTGETPSAYQKKHQTSLK